MPLKRFPSTAKPARYALMVVSLVAGVSCTAWTHFFDLAGFGCRCGFRGITLAGVGKSCIILRYTTNKFSTSYITTIGIDFKNKVIDIGDKKVQLDVRRFCGPVFAPLL